MLVPKNQSENDVESRGEQKNRENSILFKVTFGITILNSKLFMQEFLKLINELYKRNLELLALTERKKKEEEERKLKEQEELKKRKMKTVVKLGKEDSKRE